MIPKFTFVTSKMQKYITYFFVGLFLLFVAGSRVLSSNHLMQISHYTHMINCLNQTYEKSFAKQTTDNDEIYSSDPSDNDLQLFDNILRIITTFAGIFGSVYFLDLLHYRHLKLAVSGFISHFSNVKRFILIRSIRI